MKRLDSRLRRSSVPRTCFTPLIGPTGFNERQIANSLIEVRIPRTTPSCLND
jgi:hypothetical protein